MIKFATPEAKAYMKEIVAFAKEVGAIDKLVQKLQYLANYRGGESECFICKDFAPQSFYLSMFNTEGDQEPRLMWNGGLIYSGPGQPLNGSAPAMTVSLDADDAAGARHNWSVHT